MKIASQAGADRFLVGRTIRSVDLRPISNGRGGTAYDPEIVLDDGSVLSFVVRETETSGNDYSVELHRESATRSTP